MTKSYNNNGGQRIFPAWLTYSGLAVLAVATLCVVFLALTSKHG